jgi:hypothetical protein
VIIFCIADKLVISSIAKCDYISNLAHNAPSEPGKCWKHSPGSNPQLGVQAHVTGCQPAYNLALGRAQQGQALSNYQVIFEGFMAKGIAEADIRPRENSNSDTGVRD